MTIMSFIAEFWEFLRESRKFWLLPIVLVMLVCGGLVIVSKGSAVSPFIYAIF